MNKNARQQHQQANLIFKLNNISDGNKPIILTCVASLYSLYIIVQSIFAMYKALATD